MDISVSLPRKDSLATYNIFCEALEARIAPATLVNASTLTFQDIDGDAVRVAFSKKVLTSQEAVDHVFSFAVGPETGEFLQTLDLSALGLTPAKLRGLNISITAEAANGGDGQVDIGFLNAAGIDLGKVTVDGALQKIVAGDAKMTTVGIKFLTVESLGLAGGNEPANFSSIASLVTGALTKLHVAGDVAKASLSVEGGNRAGIGQLFVGGSLIGGTAEDSGSIQASGKIGKAVIEGSVEGGEGTRSGMIRADAGIGTIEIQQDLIGGRAKGSGSIFSGESINKATVGGSLIGNTGEGSGCIEAEDLILRAVIGSQLIGGAGDKSGSVLSFQGKIGHIKHDGNSTAGAGKLSGQFYGFEPSGYHHEQLTGHFSYNNGSGIPVTEIEGT